MLLHRVVDRSHLLHLEIPNELAAGSVEAQNHDAIDEKPLVPEELALAVRRSVHDDEGGEFVVAEHLEEVEHPLSHVGRVLHERVERAERIEREELELVTVHLAVFFSSRRRHTRFDCDWSSDVCSSDLDEVFHRLSTYLPTPRDKTRYVRRGIPLSIYPPTP